MTTDDVTLEHLDALAVALFDAVVNLYMGAREELGNLLDLLLLDCADVVHCLILFLSCHSFRVRAYPHGGNDAKRQDTAMRSTRQ